MIQGGTMKVRLNDIEMAFEYVSGGTLGEHSALLSRETGEIYYQSDIGDSDELPEDFEDAPESYVEIPHKNDLDLGRKLVLDFISENLPNDYSTVQRIFSSRGAYSRFKSFLQQKNLLEAWYEYEDARQKQALREWCIQEEIDIHD
jgi:hypothetical protein